MSVVTPFVYSSQEVPCGLVSAKIDEALAGCKLITPLISMVKYNS